jgi:hypothetical protein
MHNRCPSLWPALNVRRTGSPQRSSEHLNFLRLYLLSRSLLKYSLQLMYSLLPFNVTFW